MAQAREASERRRRIGERYAPTPEEVTDGKLRLKQAIESLSVSATLEEVAQVLDRMYDEENPREIELKQMLMESMVAKISESIRHFLPEDVQQEFKNLLDEMESSNFTSFHDIYTKVEEYELVFNRFGITSEIVAKYFKEELEAYLLK